MEMENKNLNGETEEQNKRGFTIKKENLKYQNIDEFVCGSEVNRERLSMAFIGAGQGGGKIAAEFCRFGYPLFAYNTCAEDLQSLTQLIDGMDEHGRFEPLYLEGDGGSAKSIKKGREAIARNAQPLQQKIVGLDFLSESSFVWICVALGGGTGAGSLTVTASVMEALRQDKKIIIDGAERTTVGVIAAIPDKTAKSKVRMNVASALFELTQLHQQEKLGAVVLIDNQKLIDDFEKNNDYNFNSQEDQEKNWATDGNAKVARVITELALSTGCSSSEMLDRAEMLDIWGMPGFMTMGKEELNEEIVFDKYDNNKDFPNKYSQRENAFESIIKETFNKNIFVEGADQESLIHGGLVVVSDGKVIRSGDSHVFKKVMSSKIFNNDAMEEPHFGFISTDKAGTLKNPSSEGARIFTMSVSKRVPEYIDKWCESAKESRDKYASAREAIRQKTSIEGLTEEDIKTNSESISNKSEAKVIDFSEMFKGQDLNKKREDSLNDVKNIFDQIMNTTNNSTTQDQKPLTSKRNESIEDMMSNLMNPNTPKN